MQTSQITNASKVSSVSPHYHGSLYSSSRIKSSIRSSSVSSFSGPGRSTTVKKLPASKSVQDLASLRSPQSVEIGTSTAMDEDWMRLLNDSSKEVLSGGPSSRLLSPPRPTGPRAFAPGVKPSEPISSPTGPFRVAGSSSLVATPLLPDSAISHILSHDAGSNQDKVPRKHTVSDMLNLIPSLQGLEASTGINKQKRISESALSQHPSSELICKAEGYRYGNFIAEANQGNAPSSVYVSALLHVVRHCSLCIKHARLTSQMEALDVPYIKEVGLRNASSNLWFRLQCARGDSWPHNVGREVGKMDP